MTDFFLRTEDIQPEDVLDLFVETGQDRRIVDTLKGRNPTILVGSRGIGKSFLLRVAQAELSKEFSDLGAFPVYVSFSRSSLLRSNDPLQFTHWMLARLCSGVLRGLWKQGLLASVPSGLSLLAGEKVGVELSKTKIESIAEQFEESWRNPNSAVMLDELPSVEQFREAIEDTCSALGIKRIVVFIDEAAHVFLPEQQRQFFTLFRDIRSPYLVCNAAVYPGVTTFGDTFQPAHDATWISIDRDILSSDYVANMREIVNRQADSTLLASIARNGQNFAILAYAATGNPRILLKTISRVPRVSSREINEVVREFYRTEIWAEHSSLAEKFIGHRDLVDWGRTFIEGMVLPEMKAKNEQYLASDKRTSSFLWVHRDAPEPVRHALRLLAYTGIVSEHSTGIKATRGEIGTRYIVNLGCLFAQESQPTNTAFEIGKNLDPRRMTEFGANHSVYATLVSETLVPPGDAVGDTLAAQLDKMVDVLDITPWQKDALHKLGFNTLGEVLSASEQQLQEAYYVGEKRSRRMKNAATAAVLEYLSG